MTDDKSLASTMISTLVRQVQRLRTESMAKDATIARMATQIVAQNENLTAVQARCTAMKEQIRAYEAQRSER